MGKRIASNRAKTLEKISNFGEAYVSKNPDRVIDTIRDSLKYMQTDKNLYLYARRGSGVWVDKNDL